MSITAFPVHGSQAFQRWLASQDRAIVHFHGTACPYAQAFRPVFESLAPEAPAPVAVRELDLDVDRQWEEHGIEVTPTVVLYEKGREVRRLEAASGVGLAAPRFRRWLKELE